MSQPVTFTAASPRHALPFLFAGQAQREFFVNQALAQIDALLHPVVEGELSAPPAAPQPGQCWLVADGPAGAWAGHPQELACWDGQQWLFVPPASGMSVHDVSFSARRQYIDGTWRRSVQPAPPAGGNVVDAEARATISAICDALRHCGIFSAA